MRHPAGAGQPPRAVARSPLPHVFVLGAGFSQAVSEAMPLLAELGKRIARELVKRPAVQLLPEAVQLALRKGVIPLGDLENWLSSLASVAPFASEAEAHYNAGIFAEIAEVIGAEIDASERDAFSRATPPAWLLKLVHLWNTVGATLITFNYDTLVEHASYDIGPADDRWPNVAYTLLKVHGSTNWWRTRGVRDSAVEQEPLIAGWGFEEVGRQGIGDERVLIPPVAVKETYYDPNFIRRLWQQARLAVESASSLWVAGYRMPLNDLATTSLVGQYLAANAEIVVADLNPDGPAGAMSQVGRFVSAGIAGATAVEEMADAYEKHVAGLVVPQFADMLEGFADDVPVMVRIHEPDPKQLGAIGEGFHAIARIAATADELVLHIDEAPLRWDDGPKTIATSAVRRALADHPRRILMHYLETDQTAIALSELRAWPTAEGIRWIFVEA